MYVCVYIYIYIYIHLNIHTYIHTHTTINSPSRPLHTPFELCTGLPIPDDVKMPSTVCEYEYSYIRMCVCVYIYIYIYIYIPIYIHTHTLPSIRCLGHSTSLSIPEQVYRFPMMSRCPQPCVYIYIYVCVCVCVCTMYIYRHTHTLPSIRLLCRSTSLLSPVQVCQYPMMSRCPQPC